jgi:hypothetical protein
LIYIATKPVTTCDRNKPLSQILVSGYKLIM